MKWLISILALSSVAHAKIASFELKDKHKVTVTHPDNWETARELYGIPLAVLGPYANESRPVLSILPTNVKKEKHSEAEFQKLFQEFKTKKEEWVSSHKGKLLKYEPLTLVEPRQDLKGHFIGAEYAINGIHFVERSYYLYCKGEVYNLKYSIRDEHRKYIPDLQKMIGDFKCE
ncbi:hypothetical protein [Peredibacter starrii]|uniref:Uncharacterized protein n=1 Tax=Peredibacter starrii TaxID=28202 RepID=A0AAX4HRZ6_9BACT|nr:hypothetical protein [Peredibacter starrii]WPU65996.1 hypothetical protein SOO65_04490 [Peredibacter starrii]